MAREEIGVPRRAKAGDDVDRGRGEACAPGERGRGAGRAGRSTKEGESDNPSSLWLASPLSSSSCW